MSDIGIKKNNKATGSGRRSAIRIMGSLIGSYFAAYNWHGGSMIALVLLAIMCIFALVTDGADEEDARMGGALL